MRGYETLRLARCPIRAQTSGNLSSQRAILAVLQEAATLGAKPPPASSNHSPPEADSSLVMKGSPVRVRASAFRLFAGIFRSDRGLSEGVEGSTRGPPNEVLRVEPSILQLFFLTADRRKVIRGLSSPVTHSHPESRLTLHQS
jgi:hypothetical protein